MKNLTIESLQNIFLRDLGKLESELLLYPDEASIWRIQESIKNPAGNLCLHLCGNLQYYIGTVLGKTNYTRDRDKEFTAKDISRTLLIKEIGAAKKAIEDTMPIITEDQLKSNYPVEVFGKPMTTMYFLIHLTAHFSYHLGQVNYHRRLVAC